MSLQVSVSDGYELQRVRNLPVVAEARGRERPKMIALEIYMSLSIKFEVNSLNSDTQDSIPPATNEANECEINDEKDKGSLTIARI